ncbi:MAG: hypothetical protein SWY16_02060 [Cyanobacteriota bacterium]|nr:hypothetical protein [Cyanobacteriota bacterium]
MKEIDPSVLRQLWSTIENIQVKTLTTLDDASLVDRLMGEFGKQRRLNGAEADSIYTYLKSRISLIRELACARPGIIFLNSTPRINSRKKQESSR